VGILSKLLKSDAGDRIPAPGTPPTYDENGLLVDPGNPWIGPINRKKGYPTEGWSGSQRRTILRAEQRRLAAEARVATRNYQRAEKAREQYEAFVAQRARIFRDEIETTPGLYRNVLNDQHRRAVVTKAFGTQAERQQATKDRAADRLDARRIARFKAGKPRGKDLREDVMNQYSSFLPPGYWKGQYKFVDEVGR
jgi:hypothetical protein